MKHNMFEQKKLKPTLRQKFLYFFSLQTEWMMWIHKDVTSRKKFKRINTWIIVSVFLLFCIGVGLFAGFGLKADFDKDRPVNPFYLDGEFNVGIIIGLVIFSLAFVIGMILAVIIPILFKESQARYVQTDEWKKSAAKFKTEKYLRSLNFIQLKWAKKMLYINKPTFVLYRHALLHKKK